MELQLFCSFVPAEKALFEIVERKGVGNPDTLSDTLAEELSIAYSEYCLSKFGAILRHQFDKLTLMCGRSEVGFGQGRLLAPIRVLINGRASPRLGDVTIPLTDIFEKTTNAFFKHRFPMLNCDSDLRLMIETNHSTTGGIRGGNAANSAPIHYRFNPRNLDDLPETKMREGNDTSIGCAFAPFSLLERFVKELEGWLNSADFKVIRPWLGSDIKLMAQRSGQSVALTIAAPLLSTHTESYEAYQSNVKILEDDIRKFSSTKYGFNDLALTINAGDDISIRKLYMNWTGSSIESGDEGQVGRGNRFGGIIAPLRPISMEGICGKNPVYHAGKVYSAAASDIAWRLHEEFGVPIEVYLISQMGRPLHDPWKIIVRSADTELPSSRVTAVASEVLGTFPEITRRILRREYPLC